MTKAKKAAPADTTTTNGAVADRQVEPAIGENVVLIPIEEIHPAPDNPRRQLGDLTELVESIREVGILQPLVVTPTGTVGVRRYTIVFGHRRRAAAELAEVVRLPAIVRAYAETERVVAMGVENIAREDLTPLEEAEFFASLTRAPHKLSQREVAARVGRSQAHVSKRVALLLLPAEIHQAVDNGRISLEAAVELSSIAEEPGFEEVAGKVLKTHRDIADSRWLTQRIKAELGEAAAVGRREATRKRLEAEGKKVLGEARESWQAGPGYPAATLDHVIRVAGKKFDATKHGELKCAGWFITHEGEAVEACAEYHKHEGKRDQRVAEDPERKAQREERERYVEAMDKLRARRHDYIKKILAGGLGADARDHVVRQAICIYEPNWDLAFDWLGIELEDDGEHRFDFAPHYAALRWIQEAPSKRQLQASLALVLEEAEGILRHETPKTIGEDMAPLARQHFEFLSFAGYKLAPQEQAWLAGGVAERSERQADTAPDAAASSELGSPELDQESNDVDLDSLITSVRKKLERVVVERGNLERAVSIKRATGAHMAARRKELEAVKQSEWALEAELSELEARRQPASVVDTTAPEIVTKPADQHSGGWTAELPQPSSAETASQRMERERRVRIDAAKATMSPEAVLAREG